MNTGFASTSHDRGRRQDSMKQEEEALGVIEGVMGPRRRRHLRDEEGYSSDYDSYDSSDSNDDSYDSYDSNSSNNSNNSNNSNSSSSSSSSSSGGNRRRGRGKYTSDFSSEDGSQTGPISDDSSSNSDDETTPILNSNFTTSYGVNSKGLRKRVSIAATTPTSTSNELNEDTGLEMEDFDPVDEETQRIVRSFWGKHNPSLDTPDPPWKSLALALFLLLGGIIVEFIGFSMLTGHIETKGEDWKKGYPLIGLGVIMLLPGGYESYIAYGAWSRWKGYSYDQIPAFD